VRVSSDLAILLAHEFHHSYLSGLSVNAAGRWAKAIQRRTTQRTRALFAFWRTYGEAEVARGNPSPFSPKAVALLDALERRYRLDKGGVVPF
jgi:hypothetical protein